MHCTGEDSRFRGHIYATVIISTFVTWLLFVVNVVYEPDPASIVYAVCSTVLFGALCGLFESVRLMGRVVPL